MTPLAFWILLFSSVPCAAESLIQLEVEPTEEKEETSRWKGTLHLGLNASMNHSSNVVGATNGSNVSLGVFVNGSLDYRKASYDWQNKLKLQYTQTRTPALDSFVKTVDNLDLRSAYFHHLKNPKIGPFAQLKAQTQLFPTNFIDAEAQTLRLIRRNGVQELVRLDSEESFDLAEPLEPLVLTETLGFFYHPLNEEKTKLEIQTGFGARQILVGDGFVLDDDENTEEIELQQLEGASQAGFELSLNSRGQLSERILWESKANLFYPVLNSSDSDGSGLQQIQAEFSSSLSIGLTKWASLDYILNLKRIPQLLDAWQIQNGLVLKAGIQLFE